jgi:hypothetical protein
MWEPRRLTTLWASTACYRNHFTFSFTVYLKKIKPKPKSLFEGYRLFVERSFACTNDPESYAGGSVRNW